MGHSDSDKDKHVQKRLTAEIVGKLTARLVVELLWIGLMCWAPVPLLQMVHRG